MPYIQSAVHAFEPSYVRRFKQPFIGGTYQPLANDGKTNTPSNFRARHRAELYTQKTPLHVTGTRKSIYTPEEKPSLTNIPAIESVQNDVSSMDSVSADSASVDSASSTGDTALQTVEHAIKMAGAALTTAGHALAHAGHVTAKTVKTATHAVQIATTKVRSAWRTFTSFKAIQLIIKFFQSAHGLWKKRMKFSYAFYTAVFFLLTSAETLFMKWILIEEPAHAAGAKISKHKKLVQGSVGQLTEYVTNMWLTDHQHIFILNFVGLALIYLVLIFVINRFWIATLIFGSVITAFGVANKIKISVRNEPIIPADFTFVSGGNAGNIMSFVPKDSQPFVNAAINVVIWFVIACIIFFILDGRRRFIHCSWRHPFSNIKNISGNIVRISSAILSVTLLLSFTWNLSIPSSSIYQWAKKQGYNPQLFSTIADAQLNGPSTTFLSLTNVKIMDQPANYSKKTMNAIASKYKKASIKINKNRTNRLTDNTVIMVLSESFSDPLRAPRVSYSIDPMPNIRAIKNQTTSGLMLSPGYGGGTANIEYQEITGLNLANFNASLTVPYQQLVSNQKNPYAFNQIWTQRYGIKAAEAVHPYAQNMYLRHTNYKKFGFDHFYTDDSNPRAPHRERIDSSPYIDDSSAYQDVVDLVKEGKSNPQFLQLITMQNHTPYNDWYTANEFKEANTSTNLSGWERDNIDTYAKGVSYTDQATADFLNQLNGINKPITVIFYGDHLPGIYPNSFKDKNNDLPLHETDYFIWSNNTSSSHNNKLDSSISAYTSSNYFMALAAEHMNAKITPYLALLTKLYRSVPAMDRISFTQTWTKKGTATYLDANGNILNPASFSKKTKQLLQDYKLVQYDMTAGKNYLSSTDFMKE